MDKFDEVIKFGNLYDGLRKSQKNVMWKDSVAAYSLDGLKNTWRLKRDLVNGTYRISRYQKFVIHEPKTREIIATRIRDRQFQRSMCDAALYRDITKGFIHTNCACQRGKGVDFAMKHMTEILRKYYLKHGSKGWVLRCDIRHYFPETPHETAKAAVRKREDDERICEKVDEIIDSFGGDRGIGLGSQVSQLIELAVLDDLDHHIKERLRMKYYIRYMDDFLVIHPERAVLEEVLKVIRERITQLGLELNRKTQIHSLDHGIMWLKWHYTLTNTGKIIRKMDRKKIVKQRRKMKKLTFKIMEGHLTEKALDDSFQSWQANARRGHSHFEVRAMERLYRILKEAIIMGPKIDDMKRLAEVEARAKAAAIRCEKLADLLELKLAETDEGQDALERLDAQDAAICELAEIIGGEE